MESSLEVLVEIVGFLSGAERAVFKACSKMCYSAVRMARTKTDCLVCFKEVLNAVVKLSDGETVSIRRCNNGFIHDSCQRDFFSIHVCDTCKAEYLCRKYSHDLDMEAVMFARDRSLSFAKHKKEFEKVLTYLVSRFKFSIVDNDKAYVAKLLEDSCIFSGLVDAESVRCGHNIVDIVMRHDHLTQYDLLGFDGMVIIGGGKKLKCGLCPLANPHFIAQCIKEIKSAIDGLEWHRHARELQNLIKENSYYATLIGKFLAHPDCKTTDTCYEKTICSLKCPLYKASRIGGYCRSCQPARVRFFMENIHSDSGSYDDDFPVNTHSDGDDDNQLFEEIDVSLLVM